MVHAVSNSFERFEHMSPPALVLAALLHALVAAFLLWTPVHHPADTDEAIEVTMEAPPPPPPEPKQEPAPEAPKPPPVAAAKPPPPPPPLNLRGLQPAAPLGEKTEGPGKPSDKRPNVKPTEKIEEPAPEKSEAPQQALAPPPPPAPEPPAPTPPAPTPPAPTLEKELPPLEAPAAPLTSRDFPKAAPAPPKPEPKPEPKPPVQAQPQPQPQRPPAPAPRSALAPSPLSHLPPRGAPPPSVGRDNEPSSTFVNPADVRARNNISDFYLQQINYKISQQHTTASEDWVRLSVVIRFTVGRDGRLLDASVARSSGVPEADNHMIQVFHRAAPFPPLPPEMRGDSITYTVPVGFVPH